MNFSDILYSLSHMKLSFVSLQYAARCAILQEGFAPFDVEGLDFSDVTLLYGLTEDSGRLLDDDRVIAVRDYSFSVPVFRSSKDCFYFPDAQVSGCYACVPVVDDPIFY